MMEQREKLIELIREAQKGNMLVQWGDIADHLLANGVVIPCRCGECEYSDVAYCRDGKTESKTDIWCVYNEDRHKNNYYCADAKRKGGDE